jgi:hypothetical protein
MSKTRKILTGLGIWLGVGLVVALALVAHPPTAGAKPSPTTVPVTTVVDTTLPPPTTTLCNGSYKNCQPYPETPPTTLPPTVFGEGNELVPPPVAADPASTG